MLVIPCKKKLPIGRGGAILTDDLDAYEWIKIGSFDGRHPGVALADDKIDMVGWNCYMTPKMAARGASPSFDDERFQRVSRGKSTLSGPFKTRNILKNS